MKRVGIYAGTFDPIHSGHVAFAEEAIKQCGLDKIYFLIEARPRRKQGVRAFDHRAAMVQLGLSDRPKLGTMIMGQDRFTVSETLPILLERFKKMRLYLLLGDDVARYLAEWPHIGELSDQARLIIGTRKLSSDALRKQMEHIANAKGISFKYDIVKTDHSTISSSNIRLALKHGQRPEGLLPETEEYISQNKLYLSQD